MLEYKSRSKAQLEKIAEVSNLVCIFGESEHLLLVDLDFPRTAAQSATLEMMAIRGLIKDKLTTVSKGGRIHEYYAIRDSTDRLGRLLYQSLLGSDPMRDFINARFDDDPITLFETPKEAERVQMWMDTILPSVEYKHD